MLVSSGNSVITLDYHTFILGGISISAEDFPNIGGHITTIIIDKCICFEWEKLLNKVSDVTEVVELCLTHCELCD
jgi:hypothetical protein